jgi:hypothetical protein
MSCSLRLAVPDECPDELATELSSRRAQIEEWYREGCRVFLLATSPGGRIFARYSTDPADEAVLRHERAVRELIGAGAGTALRSPAVHAEGPGWMIEQAVDAEPCQGAAAVDAIVAAAAEVASLPLPAGPWDGAPDLRRRVKMLAGVVRSPLPLRHVFRARRALSGIVLPLVPAHGDFRAGNLLYERGTLWVVDWELSGLRPVGHDLMQAWVTLERGDDRERLFEATVSLVGRRHRSQLERLRYASAVASVVDKLTAPDAFNRDPNGARRLLAELPALGRGLAG